MPKSARGPRITVVCTHELLQQLLAADAALKHTRGKYRRPADAINALTVQVMSALSKATAEPVVIPAGTVIDRETGAFVLQAKPDAE